MVLRLFNSFRPALVLSLLLLAFARVAVAGEIGTADVAYKIATELYTSSNWPAAAKSLGEFANQFPDDPRSADVSYFQAQASALANDHRQAVEAYGRFLDRVDVGDLPNERLVFVRTAMFRRGESAYQSQQLGLARQVLMKFVERFPSDDYQSHALLYLGDLSLRENPEPVGADVRQAQSFFEKAMSCFPEGPLRDACKKRIALCDRIANSRPHLEQIFAAGPRDESRWREAGLRLAQMDVAADEVARAADTVAKVLKSAPPAGQMYRHALLLSGKIAAMQTDWAKAKSSFERYLNAADVDTTDGAANATKEAQYWLAESLFRMSRNDEAYRAFAPLANDESQHTPMVRLRMAQLLARRGRPEDWNAVIKQVTPIATRYPQFGLQFEADYLLGLGHARRGGRPGEFEAARQSYRRVLSHPAANGTQTAAMAQLQIGETLLHQQRPEEALREFLRVEVLHDWPEWQARALLQAGACHEVLRRPRAAVEMYSRLVSRHATSDEAAEAKRRLASEQLASLDPARTTRQAAVTQQNDLARKASF